MSFVFAPLGSPAATFLALLHDLLTNCVHTRDCPCLPDEAWLHLGMQRVLHELPSGRAFLQQHGFAFAHCPSRGNYLESLKSPRRLRLVTELNQRLSQQIATTLADALEAYSQLADFDLYAGDGHWHGAAHDAPIMSAGGQNQPVKGGSKPASV